jgi:hypothetical protein
MTVWSARGFAGPAHVQAMENIRELLKNAGVPAGSTMLVRMPALNIEFLAYRDTGGLHLTPINDLVAAGLKAGQTLARLARLRAANALGQAAQRPAHLSAGSLLTGLSARTGRGPRARHRADAAGALMF